MIDDVPPIEPCLIHLAGWCIREFSFEFIQALKARGFQLSIDMQGFIFTSDHETGILSMEDIPEKKEILRMADFLKLDALARKDTDRHRGRSGSGRDIGGVGEPRDRDNLILRGHWLEARGKTVSPNLPTGVLKGGWDGAIQS